MESSSTRRRPATGNSNGLQGENTDNASGCMIGRRRNAFLQVLCRHLIHRNRIQPRTPASEVTTAPALQVLTNEEALDCDATCRICFEGPIMEQPDEESNMLVAPCMCRGGSKWIHLKCLRRWQIQVLFGSFRSTSSTAATVCNVCKEPYQVSPPPIMRLRRNLLHKGTLLVYSANPSAGTFHKSVVSLLNLPNNNSCPYGLILNIPLEDQGRVSMGDENLDGVVSWRRGGPVCGGRCLGVNKYIVAHTKPPNTEQQKLGPYLSIPVFDSEQEDGQNHRLHILVSSVDRRPLVPALFNRNELVDVVKTLVDPHDQENKSGGTADSVNQVICFLGYCKWRSGQLDREVQRGAWRVCNNGTDHDVLRNDVTGLWSEMMQSGNSRILPPIQLFEDP